MADLRERMARQVAGTVFGLHDLEQTWRYIGEESRETCLACADAILALPEIAAALREEQQTDG
jgi:hypothetical protein